MTNSPPHDSQATTRRLSVRSNNAIMAYEPKSDAETHSCRSEPSGVGRIEGVTVRTSDWSLYLPSWSVCRSSSVASSNGFAVPTVEIDADGGQHGHQQCSFLLSPSSNAGLHNLCSPQSLTGVDRPLSRLNPTKRSTAAKQCRMILRAATPVPIGDESLTNPLSHPKIVSCSEPPT